MAGEKRDDTTALDQACPAIKQQTIHCDRAKGLAGMVIAWAGQERTRERKIWLGSPLRGYSLVVGHNPHLPPLPGEPLPRRHPKRPRSSPHRNVAASQGPVFEIPGRIAGTIRPQSRRTPVTPPIRQPIDSHRKPEDTTRLARSLARSSRRSTHETSQPGAPARTPAQLNPCHDAGAYPAGPKGSKQHLGPNAQRKLLKTINVSERQDRRRTRE